ncbi:MAG TPA: 3-deoxy-manno-octulosonate cytidylyltransferase [Nitrospinota bacterium]|nr:3-deoxy-manno-octulosonate cytidylyltransferase [Nitrospinota bacterium]
MDITVIIPARYYSTRFPGKPLAKLKGKTLIQHVYERTLQSKLTKKVVVATDDKRILDEVKSFGGEAYMTSKDHLTGTDRIAELAREIDSSIIVNVQGDEPFIESDSIDITIKPLLEENSLVMSTIKVKIEDIKEIFDFNVVKVVTDKDDFALYFSRWPIPFLREKWCNILNSEKNKDVLSHPTHLFKHLGLYAYKRDFLLQYTKWPRTPLEKIENLEQLRVLENGYKIKVVEGKYDSIGIDTPQDLERLECS